MTFSVIYNIVLTFPLKITLIGNGFTIVFFSLGGRKRMQNTQNRVALIGIVVADKGAVERLNLILHEYSQYIIGRMGIPYEKAGVSIISVAVDATNDIINSLSGKLGALKGVSSKTIYSKIPTREDEA